MKIRNGFVSNSSSSSFILVFDKKPETKEEFAEVMGDCTTETSWNGNFLSKDMVVDIAWGDLQHAGEATEEDLKSELASYHYEWNTDFNWWEATDEERDAHDAEEKAKNQKHYDEFAEKNKGKYMTILSYGDDCTVGSQMEHGGAFRNVDGLKISHH